MKRSFRLIILLSCLPLMSCATQGQYQEPAKSSGVAYLSVKTPPNDNFGSYLTMKPMYDLDVTNIDNQPVSNFSGKDIAITPGPHTITVTCGIDGSTIGNKQFSLNAKSGQKYVFAYPNGLNGYNFISTACNLVTLS